MDGSSAQTMMGLVGEIKSAQLALQVALSSFTSGISTLALTTYSVAHSSLQLTRLVFHLLPEILRELLHHIIRAHGIGILLLLFLSDSLTRCYAPL